MRHPATTQIPVTHRIENPLMLRHANPQALSNHHIPHHLPAAYLLKYPSPTLRHPSAIPTLAIDPAALSVSAPLRRIPGPSFPANQTPPICVISLGPGSPWS
jgi:hypothetical protein